MGYQCEEAKEVEDEETQVQEAYEAYAELEEKIGSQLEGVFLASAFVFCSTPVQ